MRYIETLREGENVKSIYMCKQVTNAITKNGKEYLNVILQDKTGQLDAKIWSPNAPGIDDFDALDYVEVTGSITVFNSAMQLKVDRIRKCHEGEYDESDYLPVSKRSIDEMYSELMTYINNIKDEQIKALVKAFFVDDTEFIAAFKKSSAAKSVHHGFIGGLLEHTLGVVKLAAFFGDTYSILNKDRLVAAALFHDMGKIKEFSAFPLNDYTDDGQLLGHMVMGITMLEEKLKQFPDFDKMVASELKHCILSHHGEFEYGAPKKPATAEAMALHFADNMDAKMETLKEMFESTTVAGDWLGYSKFFDSHIKKSV